MQGHELQGATYHQQQLAWDKVVIPMVTSPFVGLILAFLLMRLIVAIFRDRNPQKVGGGFRHAQTVSAAAMAMGHGMQDAQKTMGVIFLLMVTMGYASASEEMPVWIVIACATAISLGTAVGGKRIMNRAHAFWSFGFFGAGLLGVPAAPDRGRGLIRADAGQHLRPVADLRLDRL